MWPNGRPAADTHVSLFGAGTSCVSASVRTGADGRFTLTAFEGETSRVTALHSSQGPPRVTAQGRLDGLLVQGGTGPIRLVLTVVRR